MQATAALAVVAGIVAAVLVVTSRYEQATKDAATSPGPAVPGALPCPDRFESHSGWEARGGGQLQGKELTLLRAVSQECWPRQPCRRGCAHLG